jgi:hypothetical protein
MYPTYAFITYKGNNKILSVLPEGLTPLSVGKSNREQSRTGVYSDASIFTQNTRRRASQKQTTAPTGTSYQGALDYYFTNGINYFIPKPVEPVQPPIDNTDINNGTAETNTFYQDLNNGSADTVTFTYEYNGGVIDNVLYLFPALDGGSQSSVLLYSVDGGQYNSVYIDGLKYDAGNI